MDIRIIEYIERLRADLETQLKFPLETLAHHCTSAWQSREALDKVLQEQFATVSHCFLLYCIDINGVQVSSNIFKSHISEDKYGQDLSSRPYLDTTVPVNGFLLSDEYISATTRRPCITAVQSVVNENHQVQGFICADFDLRDLPIAGKRIEASSGWRQMKGDPSIRGSLFLQKRIDSVMDQHLDQVTSIIEELIVERGVFHCKIHYSSSRAALWFYDDPYEYRILTPEELTDPGVCLVYPKQPYPERSKVRREDIRPILDRFNLLRNADETIYLRSSSLNIISGMIGLTFSCDGSHYMSVEEFTSKDNAFWFGTLS